MGFPISKRPSHNPCPSLVCGILAIFPGGFSSSYPTTLSLPRRPRPSNISNLKLQNATKLHFTILPEWPFDLRHGHIETVFARRRCTKGNQPRQGQETFPVPVPEKKRTPPAPFGCQCPDPAPRPPRKRFLARGGSAMAGPPGVFGGIPTHGRRGHGASQESHGILGPGRCLPLSKLKQAAPAIHQMPSLQLLQAMPQGPLRFFSKTDHQL